MEEHKAERETGEEEKIDLFRLLQEFWRAVRRLFWVPLALGILGGAALGLRAWRSYTPRYMSEATFTIQTTDSALNDLAGSTSSYYSKAAAEQLAKTFPYIIQSELLQSMLRQEMGVGWLNGSITAQTVNNTNLFSLKVTSTSAQDALDILNAVIELYPRVADYVIGSTEMNILTPPVLAAAPYNPFRLARTVCKGVLAGLALGLLIILAYAATRRTIRSPEEIRRLLNQTCVAALPRVAFKRRSGSLDQNISIRNPKVSSSFQESVRSMRIKFLREAEKRESRVVMVTSTLPGEGKTTVAVNLALTLSQNGARVILVDLDLRKPSVKKCLGLQNPSRGVPELLADKGGNVLDSLLPVPGTQVRLLAGDEASTAPRRQMESRRLAVLLGMLRQEADFIVLDTPPCGILADSAALARLADSTLYVVRSGTAQVSHIVDGLQFLAGSATPLMGCVLNGVQADGGGYGYGGYHYGKYSSYAKKEEPV